MKRIPYFSLLAILVVLLPACAKNHPSHARGITGSLTAASKPSSLPLGTPLSSTYLTFPNGSKIPCDYHKIGNTTAVAVCGIFSGASPATGKRSTADLAEENYIRAKVKRGEFIPGIYKGGPVTYSTGGPLKFFTP